MFQNIKVDIIYYKTNTDFELEFNLCGCCRMRLLTDKASDQKNLVHYLARAVSRSRVILIAGSLFGNDGILQIISDSIGKPLSEISNSLYGISGGDSISVINGATPLVTPDGYFGGCIIESGPQSMILLSDNKTIRKSIMKNLIHPYIEELCALDLKEKAAAAAASYIPIPPIEAEVPPVSIPDTTVQNIESDLPTKDLDIPQPDSFAVDETETPDLQENKVLEAESDDQTESYESEQNSESEQTGTKNTQALSHEEENSEVTLSKGMIFESDDPEVTTSVVYEVSEILNSDVPVPESNITTNEDTTETGITETLPLKQAAAFETPAVKSNVSHAKGNPDYYSHNSGTEDSDSGNVFTSAANIPILIISIILLIILAILCYCIFYVPAQQGISTSTYLQQTFSALFG